MIKILRRLADYSIDEFKQYCQNNGLIYELYKTFMYQWAIAAHEADLDKFIDRIGPETVVTVDGAIVLDNTHYKVKPKTLTLKNAFKEMITPDAQDYSIILSIRGTYYVIVQHIRGHNTFKFRLNDKD